jgi:hypothetical protein
MSKNFAEVRGVPEHSLLPIQVVLFISPIEKLGGLNYVL